ncbi:hypothetical protein MRB53_022907 [Persea americana]|uniref:Uncharacterized protein n=1 Tax=Persea americana TaxID=3435 RepID=A0ACC2L808_PERAE|nr:hypothetical protein MRB53_022907 [Persea americana]
MCLHQISCSPCGLFAKGQHLYLSGFVLSTNNVTAHGANSLTLANWTYKHSLQVKKQRDRFQQRKKGVDLVRSGLRIILRLGLRHLVWLLCGLIEKNWS